jgi:hypothetical protein
MKFFEIDWYDYGARFYDPALGEYQNANWLDSHGMISYLGLNCLSHEKKKIH